MNELDSPNLLKLVTNFEDENHIYIILPLCPNGQLYDIIHKPKQKVKNIIIKKYLYQSIEAINSLHKKKIIKLQVKSDEINKSNLSLTDFEYDIEKPIGKGGFCTVYKAIYKETKKTYALKVIDK